MSIKPQEDRVHVKRLAAKNIDEELIRIKGEPYLQYRNAFENVRLNHIPTKLPLQISMELVSYCNLACKMCYRSYKENPPKHDMPMEIVDTIVQQAKELECPSIWLGAFTEPTIHPDIISILRIIATYEPLDYWMTTNGVCLTEELSEVLTDIPLTKLCVSLDAATPETYKKVRGGDYNRVLKNVHRFLEIRQKKGLEYPFLRVTFVEQEENRHEIELFKDTWENVADIVDTQKLFDYSVIQKDSEQFSEKDYGEYDCLDPYYHVLVRHDGQFMPCCISTYETDQPKYIQNMTIKEYWESPERVALMQSIRDRKFIACCKKCMSSINVG